MATDNIGNQKKLSPNFKHPATGEAFGNFLRGLIKPGIYSGGEVTFNGNTLTIAPFKVFLPVDSDKFTYKETTISVTQEAVYPKDILYITYSYKEEEENWLDWGFRESTYSPSENEIILCKINYNGTSIESIDTSYQTKGLFDENFNMSLQGSLTLTNDPLTQKQVGNIEFNDKRYMSKDVQERTLDDFRKRLQQTEEKMIHFSLENSYLMQRQSTNPNQLIETFFSEANTSKENDFYPKPCIIMDDPQSLQNNWKYREGGNPDFKNGYIKPNKRFHYLQEGDIFDLRPIGGIYKGGMSQYDPINNCYWFVTSTNFHSTNGAYSMLHKLSPDFKDGKIAVIDTWYLGNLYNVSTALNYCYWSGCDVMTTSDENGEQFLFLTITNSSASYSGAGLAKLRINNDGTLGRNYAHSGMVLDWQESWDVNTCDFHVCDPLVRANDIKYHDIVVWDEQHVSFLVNGSSSIHLEFKEIADNGFGSFNVVNPRSDVTGFANYIDYSSASITPAMAKKDNKLFIKVNVGADDNRYILELDVSEDSYDPEIGISDNYESYTGDLVGSLRYTGLPGIEPYCNSSSGFFQVSQWKSSLQTTTMRALEALAISREGDLLEQCVTNDTTYYPATLHIRKLENTKYAENQVCKMYLATNTNNINWGFEFDPDDDNYLWYATNNNIINSVRLYKKDLRDGSEQYITFNGGSIYDIYDMCFAEYDGNMYFYFVGRSTVHLAHVISKATLDANLGGTIDITVTGKPFLGYQNETKYGICSDGGYIYITNNLTNHIERWTLGDDLSNQPSQDLSTYLNLSEALVHSWLGITWYNNLFYIASSNTTEAYTGVIGVYKDTPKQDGYGFLKHLYRENKFYSQSSSLGVAIKNGILYSRGKNQDQLFGSKTLINPEVIQTHIPLSSRNVLLYDHIGWQSPIIKTYFKPEEFVEWLPVDENGLLDLSGNHDHYEYTPSKENYPGDNYMVVSHDTPNGTSSGLTILNMDGCLESAKYGEPRYDIEKIIPTHFVGSEYGDYNTCNLIVGDGYHYTDVKVEKEMIFITRGYTGNSISSLTIIDLQKGSAQNFNNGGLFYNGRLKEANLGKGYTRGQYRGDLQLTGVKEHNFSNIHVHTFTKEDMSNYSEATPTTFCIIGTTTGGHLFKIGWDENGYRNVSSLVLNIWGVGTVGEVANFIAPTGEIFGANYTTNGVLYQGKKKVWEIQNSGDVQYNNTLLAISHGDCNGSIAQISPNSTVYKLPTGEERHILIVSKAEGGLSGWAVYDIENKIVENVDLTDTSYRDECNSIINYEDKIWTTMSYNLYDQTFSVMEIEKVSFTPYSQYRSDDGYVNFRNNNQWRIKNYNRMSEPFYVLSADFQYSGGDANHTHYDFHRTKLEYSPDFGILSVGSSYRNDVGLQLLLIGNNENFCTHESITKDTENPTQYYYIQSKIIK